MIMILPLFRYIWATFDFLHNLEFNLKCVKRSSFRRFLGSLEVLLQNIVFGNFLSCNKHQLLWKSQSLIWSSVFKNLPNGKSDGVNVAMK